MKTVDEERDNNTLSDQRTPFFAKQTAPGRYSAHKKSWSGLRLFTMTTSP